MLVHFFEEVTAQQLLRDLYLVTILKALPATDLEAVLALKVRSLVATTAFFKSIYIRTVNRMV